MYFDKAGRERARRAGATTVKRNLARFPEDFAFRLDPDESQALISQIAISKPDRDRLARRFEVFLSLR